MSVLRVEGPIPQASVLIVDDERGPRDAIRLVLEPRFRVTTAESGELALEVLRHQRVDVVTLDLMMAGLGGIETFKKIREMDPDVQIIIVSGGSLDDLAHALPHTASAWIPKPFDMLTLIEAVERAAKETRCGRLRAAKSQASTLRKVRDERQHHVARTLSHDIAKIRYEAATSAVNFLHAEESDGGSIELHKTPAFLNQIVEQVMEDEVPRARLRRIDLRADLDSGLPSVDLDITMISRAVTNILNNAVHYSPERGTVRVETRRFADLMILRVRNHGLGIPSEEVIKLFERHGRGAKSASSSSTSLSLYFVRTIVEAHGGSVSATSPPDGGSSLVIILPCPPHGNA